MNLFKQLLLAGLFLSSMYCGVLLLMMGETMAAVCMLVIFLFAANEGRRLSNKIIKENKDIKP